MDVNGPSAAAVIGTEFTLIGVAAALIGARIYLRLVIQDLPLITSDILVCIAWVFTAASASYDIVFHKMGVLRSHVAYTLEGYDGTPEDVKLVWKLQWSGQFPFFTAFYLCKATLLSLYARFFPIFMETRRKILWGTMVYCSCAYVTNMLTILLICRPVQGNWSQDPAVACNPIVFARVFQIAWALNFAADLMIFCLPFLVLYQLRLRKSVKISVYCTFFLGAINLAVSLARFLGIQVSVTSFRSFTLIELWSALDLQVGLVIACLPTLRPYLSYNWRIWPFRSATQTPKSSSNRAELSELSRQNDQPMSQIRNIDHVALMDNVNNNEGHSRDNSNCDLESSALGSPKSPATMLRSNHQAK
ncbi:hypothetical protein BDP55DRAFT_652967 [Colletotrichum godetiae]|uniref:Rhodopsin domain-containing protein n=1 Tax=Colletotrichum godetiae TaxID=1209918 RepID=A0AAJ0AUS0_9PEZI|nr:uncharacterized protein BDP55DRAFT_652967 [Colletotrichum godetiae]KAK1689356.1 hypothetical protein BDP55DRAFT_652967 [Colletotrichum godetiae]